MKVNANSPQNPALVDTSDNAKATQKAADTSKVGAKAEVKSHAGGAIRQSPGSTVEISDTARLLQKAADLVSQTPDVRADRVAGLKKSIADGTYKVDGGALAERLLEEHLNAHFGKNNF